MIENVLGTLPDYGTVRGLIQNIPTKQYRLAATYGYIIAGRVSEIVSQAYPSDTKTTPNGPKGKDVHVTDYEDEKTGEQHEVVVFHVNTSKRDGVVRDVGIPLSREYEPFTETVLEYFEGFDEEDPIFDYTRQELYRGVIDTFKGYVYEIEPYTIRKIDQDKFNKMLEEVPAYLRDNVKPPKQIVEEIKVPKHTRRLANHGAYRHFRIMELARKYRLIEEERHLYTGHTISGSDPRYSHLAWWVYFPKLLRKY